MRRFKWRVWLFLIAIAFGVVATCWGFGPWYTRYGEARQVTDLPRFSQEFSTLEPQGSLFWVLDDHPLGHPSFAVSGVASNERMQAFANSFGLTEGSLVGNAEITRKKLVDRCGDRSGMWTDPKADDIVFLGRSPVPAFKNIEVVYSPNSGRFTVLCWE